MPVAQRLTRKDAWWRHDPPQWGWLGATALTSLAAQVPAHAQRLSVTVPPPRLLHVWDTQPQQGWGSVLIPPFAVALYAPVAAWQQQGILPPPRHTRAWWPTGSPQDLPHRLTFGIVTPASLILDDVTVAFTAHVLPLDAPPGWLDAAASTAIDPVVLLEFLTYQRTLSSRPVPALPALELEIAPLREGGVGALEQSLDELTDSVSIGNASVRLVNPALLARTLSNRALLNTPARLKLGLLDQEPKDYYIAFTGVVDRFQATYPSFTLALTDTTLQTRVNLAFPLDGSLLFASTPQTLNLGTLIPLFLGVHVNAPTIQTHPDIFVIGLGVDRVNRVRLNGLPITNALVGWESATGFPMAWLTLLFTPEPDDVITVDVNATAPLFAVRSVPTPPSPASLNLLTNGGFESGTTGWTTAAGGVLTTDVGPGGPGGELVTNGDFATGDPSGWTFAAGGTGLVGTGIAPELLTNPGFDTGDTLGWSVEPGATVTIGYAPAGTPDGSASRAELLGGLNTSLGLTQDVTILEGHPYLARAMVFNTGTTGALFAFTTTTLGLGTPGTPDVYGTMARDSISGWDLEVVAAIPVLGPTLHVRIGSEYDAAVHPSYADQLSVKRAAADRGLPLSGAYRLELYGGDGVDGEAYQDVTVEVGATYDVTAALYDIGNWAPLVASAGRLLVGTPGTPDDYATLPGTTPDTWQPLSATVVPTSTTLRLTLQSQHTGSVTGAILPSLVTGVSVTKRADAPTTAPPYEGTARAALLGGNPAYGQAYQDGATVPGATYTWAAALWQVADLPHGQSYGVISWGTPTVVAAYAAVSNTVFNAWQVHTGTFVATETVTRVTLEASWGTSGSATPAYVDAVSLVLGAAAPTLPILHDDDGENPVDAITWILLTFDPAATMDAASFAAARTVTLAQHKRVVGRLTAPTDSFTLSARIARQTGMLLQKNAKGAYMLTMLDDDRPIALSFDPLNMHGESPDEVVISSTPLDALYTSVYVYFDTVKGGSTSIADYANVAYVTPTRSNAVGAFVEPAKLLCETALAMVGTEQRLEFFADLISDPATAYRCLDFLVNRYCRPYFTVQYRTWLDALPLHLADIVSVTHPLMLSPGQTSRAEVLQLRPDLSTMSVGITARAPSSQFVLEAPPPVTRYMQATGHSGAAIGAVDHVLALSGTNFLTRMTGATSLTLLLVVSHVTSAGIVLGLTQNPSTVVSGAEIPASEAFRIDLGIDTLTAIMGSGAPSHHAVYSGGAWSCEPDVSSPQVTATFAAGTPLDQTQLSLYCVTFDWRNHALYVSGSLTGIAHYDATDLEYTTCVANANPAIAPVQTTLQQDFFVADPALNAFSTVVCRGLAARVYEYLLIASTSPRSIYDVVTTIHAPLLAYMSALYTPGVVVTAPLSVPLGDYRLWYRDRYTPTTPESAITAWHTSTPAVEGGLEGGILMTLLAVGGGDVGIPLVKTATGVTPAMMTGLQVAPTS